MKSRLKIAIAAIVLIAVVGIPALMLGLRNGPPEAYYHGKSATYWLGELRMRSGEPAAEVAEAMQAFREMGTNAYPVLFGAFACQNASSPGWPRFQNWLASIPRLGGLFARPRYSLDLRGAAELVVINTDSGAFTSQLLQLLKPTNSEVRLSVLAAAAGHIGPANRDQVPELLAVLDDRSPYVRHRALSCLGAIGLGASNAIPAISNACRDTDLEVRINAAWALWRIAHETNTAAPVLEAVLFQNDSVQRHWAACYLQHMEGNNPALISVFIESVTNFDQGVRMSACALLSSYGSAAKATVPNLLTALNDPSSADVRNRAMTALREIDPEAAKSAVQQ